jgi:hypothetical protein
MATASTSAAKIIELANNLWNPHRQSFPLHKKMKPPFAEKKGINFIGKQDKS